MIPETGHCSGRWSERADGKPGWVAAPDERFSCLSGMKRLFSASHAAGGGRGPQAARFVQVTGPDSKAARSQ